MLLWELETGSIPFDKLDDRTMKYMLLDQKLRPLIPESTDKGLTTLIRRCWQDNAQKRPNFQRIVQFLDKVKFS